MWVDTGYLLLRPQRPPRSLTIAYCVHYLLFLVWADFESYKTFLFACSYAGLLAYGPRGTWGGAGRYWLLSNLLASSCEIPRTQAGGALTLVRGLL